MSAAPGQAPEFAAIDRIRIALRLLAMGLWLLACVIVHPLWRAARRNPVPRVFMKGVTWLSGVNIRLSGARAPGGAFLLANHVSWIDIPAITGATGAVFVAHDGLASHPFMRWLCGMNDTVFIARHERGTVARQIEQLREATRENGALAMFPEGTTSDGTGLLPFKSSLLSAFAPPPAAIAVQPLVLDYGSEAAEISWVGEEPGLDNFLRILARSRPVELTLHFLPPLAGEALSDRKRMAAAASAAIGGTLAQRVAL